MVLSVLLTGCAASFEGGVVDPEAADQAVSELFSDTGERVLLQGGASELDQRLRGAGEAAVAVVAAVTTIDEAGREARERGKG